MVQQEQGREKSKRERDVDAKVEKINPKPSSEAFPM